MATEYFFISDLHIGGDGELDHCDFEDELIIFLKKLEQLPKDVELIIAGDAFGLWEFTVTKGIDKLKVLTHNHPRLFEQFRKTGEKVRITLIPGNHDYELACDPEYVTFLQNYNIILEPEIAITRKVAGKTLWIEHGHQHDSYNAIESWGDPADKPIGYYVTIQFVSGASEMSRLGKQNWLKDIQAVYPTEYIPHWVFSNYFYKEMSPILRYLLIPFLLLFSLSIIATIAGFAQEMNLIPPQYSIESFLESIGGLGSLIGIVIAINTSIITFLIFMAIPLFFIFRDVKATLKRYKIIGKENLISDKEHCYNDAARKVFEEHKDVVAFIYGHTHSASLTEENGKAIINTGTWLKKLIRVTARSRFVPDIYVPLYSLNYFHIYEEEGKVVVAFHKVPKQATEELTLTQRILTMGRVPEGTPSIPEKTYL